MFDSLREQYNNNKSVVFEAVHLPDRNDNDKFETARKLSEKYSFKNVFADTSAWRAFNIDGVPTIVVLKNDEVIFKGDIAFVGNFLAENLMQQKDSTRH